MYFSHNQLYGIIQMEFVLQFLSMLVIENHGSFDNQGWEIRDFSPFGRDTVFVMAILVSDAVSGKVITSHEFVIGIFVKITHDVAIFVSNLQNKTWKDLKWQTFDKLKNRERPKNLRWFTKKSVTIALW